MLGSFNNTKEHITCPASLQFNDAELLLCLVGP